MNSKTQSQPFEVSVCVPSYRAHSTPNLATLADDFAGSLGRLAGELIVILNGVSAGAVHAPSFARLVDLKENTGVPHAWNVATKEARGEFVVFCNDDTLLGDNAIEVMVEALRSNPRAGVVGPAGALWDVATAEHREHVIPDGGLGDVRPCDAVSGFLFATRKETLLAAGGFDEAYSPCGFEEIDYCTTVRLRLGLDCLVVAGIAHEHEFGISARRLRHRVTWSGGRESLKSIASRNREYFLEKWAEPSSGSTRLESVEQVAR